jgi:hypothetical protein
MIKSKITIAMKHVLLFLLAAVLLATSAQAQPTSNLPSDQIEVVKSFDARLADADKLNMAPSLPPLDTNTQYMTYSIPSKLIAVEYEPPVIRPIAMKPESLPPAFKGYAKVGMGYPLSPYLEASYYDHLDKNDFGLQALYHAAKSNTVENQRFADLKLAGQLTHYTGKGFALSGNIAYDRAVRYFYGYDHDTIAYAPEDVRQIYNTIALGGKFFNSAKTQGDINYSGGIDFYRTGDDYNASEFGILAEAAITKYFAGAHPLTLKISNDFSSYNGDSEENQALNNLAFAPSFTYHAVQFYAKAGINLANSKDTFNLFPDLEVGYNVLGSSLTAFLGWTGGLRKNSLRNVSTYNPYIVSEYEMANSKLQDIYGGIKGQVKGLAYQATVGYRTVKRTPLFINDFNGDSKRFLVVYDDVNAFNVHGELRVAPTSRLEVLATTDINIYTAKQQEKAWHLPPFSLNLGGQYKLLQDKLAIKAELYSANGISALDAAGKEQNLKALLDLSAGAHYQINNNFGAFLDINNLINNKSERWLGYPTYGINVLGGLTARF